MVIRLGFLASGSGSSVEELVTRIRDGRLEGFEPAVVICNFSRGSAGIYERAKRLNLRIEHLIDSGRQLDLLKELDVDLVLGMGYVKMVGDEILSYFGNLIWNIHPTLLPKYGGQGMYGLKPHESVLEAGDQETGATVHIMGAEYDEGDILNQVKIPIFGRETPKMLQKRVLSYEYDLMADTLKAYRDGLLPNCQRGKLT